MSSGTMHLLLEMDLKFAALVLSAVLLLSGCAATTRFVTGPAAIISCPARIIVTEQKDPLFQVVAFLGAPIFGIAGWARGVWEGWDADMGKLGGRNYNSEDFTDTLTCNMK